MRHKHKQFIKKAARTRDPKSVLPATPPSPPPSCTPSAREEGGGRGKSGEEGKVAVGRQRGQHRPLSSLHHRHAPRSCGTAAVHSPYHPFTPSTPSTCETPPASPRTCETPAVHHFTCRTTASSFALHPRPARAAARAAATVALVAAESSPLIFPILGSYSFHAPFPPRTPGVVTGAASATTPVAKLVAAHSIARSSPLHYVSHMRRR